jgi:uncharacterized membrane protein required for colicin V production
LDLADLIIILIVIFMAIRGAKIGFTREIFATVGFIVSIFLGAVFIPPLINKLPKSYDKSVWAIIFMLALIFGFLYIGESVGGYVKTKFITKKLAKADRLLGGGLRVVGCFIVLWLASSTISRLPYPSVASQVQQSYIVGQINKSLPNTPKFMTTIGNTIAPNGFPMVFLGTEPLASKHISLDSTPALNAVVNAEEASVVKIEGIGCGGIVEGSGFVAAKDLIITNAHVVSGIYAPYIYDQSGQHEASVILFDPNLDLAILRTSNLAGSPLKINNNPITIGTLGAIMGYPNNQSLQAKTAAITNRILADGKNIYSQSNTLRDIYVLEGDVQKGNSGGPFIDSSGMVDGLIFAKSSVYSEQGYALSMSPISKALSSVKNSVVKVSTGRCTE